MMQQQKLNPYRLKIQNDPYRNTLFVNWIIKTEKKFNAGIKSDYKAEVDNNCILLEPDEAIRRIEVSCLDEKISLM